MSRTLHHLIASAILTLLVMVTLHVAAIARVVVLHAVASMLHSSLHAGSCETALVTSIDILALNVCRVGATLIYAAVA